MENRNPKVQRLVPALLGWFAQNARDLPWRRTHDPHAVWISEIMLQQTQVRTVVPYWERWMRELPTIQDVASASPDKIHKLWEGLGYYTRVRNLQKAARQIVEKHGGKFPDDFNDVLALPGIGRYTAGAICSIAFNQPAPILDGNVIRVLTRVFGIGENPREKKTNTRLWRLAEELVTCASRLKSKTGTKDEDEKPATCSHLNQSLMELGALVCAPRQPQCAICHLKKLCVAFRENRVAELPNLGKHAAATARHFAAFVVEQQGRFLVRQRPAGVVNAHLWEFPNVEIDSNRSSSFTKRDRSTCHSRRKSQSRLTSAATNTGVDPSTVQAAKKLGFKIRDGKPFWTVKHSITRYRITMEAWRTSFKGTISVNTPKNGMGRRGTPPSEIRGVWRSPAQMNRLAFAGAHRKLLHKLGLRP
jgi:A/G-specific adenine glycosylase